jgi:serine/threonine-protein kinase HipA
MNKGTVYYRDVPAGTLVRDAEGFIFRYDASYLDNSSLPDISATLPKRQEEYRSKVLFPFFYGLLAEGKQKERQCRELRIDENDHFTRLLETSAYGAIGAVYVKA